MTKDIQLGSAGRHTVIIAVARTGNSDSLKMFGGSVDDTFNGLLLNDVVRTAWTHPQSSDEDRQKRQSSTLVALAAFKPQDEIEGMLAAQALAMHHACMDCSRRAMLENQPFEMAQGLRKASAIASRAFIELTTAIDRKRGKGTQQRVTVEHVHVHAGGKAIVGTIANRAPTHPGGGETNIAGEPHASPAQLAHDSATSAGFAALRGEDPNRVPMSVSSNEERPMQDARGQEHRAKNRRRC